MKKYTVEIIKKGNQVSSFEIEASSLVEAKEKATDQKRLEGTKGRCFVKLVK
jgi:hypothetical protein